MVKISVGDVVPLVVREIAGELLEALAYLARTVFWPVCTDTDSPVEVSE